MLQKFKEIAKRQLTQGTSPKALALTFAAAFVLGTFPILGATTFLCFVAAWILGLNQPLIQAVNYALSPLHIILIPVFLKLGQVMFRAPAFVTDPMELQKQFREDWVLFLQRYGWAGVHAAVVWALIMPPLGVAVFFLLRPFLEKMKRAKST